VGRFRENRYAAEQLDMKAARENAITVEGVEKEDEEEPRRPPTDAGRIQGRIRRVVPGHPVLHHNEPVRNKDFRQQG
jgi:hypothetical protein